MKTGIASGVHELLVLVLLMAPAAPVAAQPLVRVGDALDAPVRGITISTHRGGREWGDRSVLEPTLAAVTEVGASWVAFHPYARIEGDGTVRFREWLDGEPPAHLVEPIRRAHAAGLRILIKPHLAYWGSPFSWRGEIEFAEQEQWDRFFETYERWIVAVARATKSADAFAVGTELDKTLDHQGAWKRIVRRVRAEHDGLLTYAANWTDFERVGFWGELDAIGIQAYFPLVGPAETSSSRPPEETELRASWVQLMKRLAAYSDDQRRPILFTELGYNRSWQTAREPWSSHTDGPDAEALQRLCTRIALEAIERERSVVGAFLWKWFPEPRPVGRDFQAASPGMRETIRAVWRADTRRPAASRTR